MSVLPIDKGRSLIGATLFLTACSGSADFNSAFILLDRTPGIIEQVKNARYVEPDLDEQEAALVESFDYYEYFPRACFVSVHLIDGERTNLTMNLSLTLHPGEHTLTLAEKCFGPPKIVGNVTGNFERGSAYELLRQCSEELCSYQVTDEQTGEEVGKFRPI